MATDTEQDLAGVLHTPGRDREKFVDRVRKLLAKACDKAATEAEREAFEAKALQLMAEHEIADRDLREASPIQRFRLPVSEGNATRGVAYLIHRLAAMNGAYSLWYQQGRVVHLYCTAAQHEAVRLLLDHLLPQLRHDMARDKPRSRKTYALAWAIRVAGRLSESQAVAYAEIGSALVPTSYAAERYAREELGTKVARPARLALTSAQDAADGGAAGGRATLGQRAVRA
jgi:hypothetical protein